MSQARLTLECKLLGSCNKKPRCAERVGVFLAWYVRFAPEGIPPYGSYLYYQTTAGATTTNPNGGLEPYIVFNLDMNYSLPVRQLGVPVLKKLDFDLSVLNLSNKHYYQYYYNQASPASCGDFTSGPFAGKAGSSYSCSGSFNDALPGEPFAATFTVTARF